MTKFGDPYRQGETPRIGDRDRHADRQGEDYKVVIRPWSVTLTYRGKSEAEFAVHEARSVGRGSLERAIGAAIVRAMERCSQ